MKAVKHYLSCWLLYYSGGILDTIRINAVYIAVCFQLFYTTKFKIDFSSISIIDGVWVKNNRKHPYVILTVIRYLSVVLDWEKKDIKNSCSFSTYSSIAWYLDPMDMDNAVAANKGMC